MVATRIDNLAAESLPKRSTSAPSQSATEVIRAPKHSSIAEITQFVGRIKSGELLDNFDGTFRDAQPGEPVQIPGPAERRRAGGNWINWPDELQRFAQAAQYRWEQSGVPPRYVHADLNNLGEVPEKYLETANILREMITTPALNALLGSRGPGKTHLACGLAREFCRYRKSARYITALDLFRGIKATWSNRGDGQSESSFIDGLERVDLLVIDEVQVRGETRWEDDQLTGLIDHRYSHLKSTLLIANLEPKAMAENLGPSIASRLTESGRVIVTKWPSMRMPGREQPAPPKLNSQGKPTYPPVDDAIVDRSHPAAGSLWGG